MAFELSRKFDEFVLCSTRQHSTKSLASPVIHLTRLVENDADKCDTDAVVMHFERKLQCQCTADLVAALVVDALVGRFV